MRTAVRIVTQKPGWVPPYNPDIAFDFALGAGWKGTGTGGGAVIAESSLLSVTRASTATDLLSTSASGFPYASFVSGQRARSPNVGLMVFEARTNNLLNSTAPATQTTASLATGTYTLWVNGSGSATSSAGTAVGTGFGAATNGTPNIFTLSGAGTVVVTVSGSLNAFQLELGAFATSLIVTAGATVTRAADVITATTVRAQAGTNSLFASGTPQATVTYGSNQGAVTLSDGTANNREALFRSLTTGVAGVLVTVASVSQGSAASSGAWGQSTFGKAAAAFEVGRMAVVRDGGAVVTAGSASVPAVTTVQIGNTGAGSGLFNGPLRVLAVWNGALSNNAIRDLTQ